MAAPKQYHATMKALVGWAEGELAHVGRIAAVEDPDIQYSYALSTVNGMAHLKDALYELMLDTEHPDKKRDIERLHDQVVRVMNHLVRIYQIDLQPIRDFNVRGVLSNLGYLEDGERIENGEEESWRETLNTLESMDTNMNRETNRNTKRKKTKRTHKMAGGRKGKSRRVGSRK